MTLDFLPQWAIAFVFVFARVGVLVMLLPGMGERGANARVRLALAMGFSLVFFPFVQPLIAVPNTPGPMLFAGLGIEILIGMMLGLTARLIVAALQVAGEIIAQDLGLSFAQSVDPSAGTQGAAIGNLLAITGVTLVMVLDLHHLAISGIGASYSYLPPGALPPTGDAAALAVKTMGTSFTLALKIAAPFIVFAIVFNLGLGVLSRLMPTLQVFFLGAPAIILLGVLVMMATIGVMMNAYIREMTAYLSLLNGR
jgi:flagellar biosynthesis protein FliR